jgi:hypothetical protein
MQSKINGRWKVIGHPTSVSLNNVKFLVSQAGRNRVLREKKKYVHAYVVGELEFSNHSILEPDAQGVTYNPYFTDSFFVNSTGKPIYTAAWAEVHASKTASIIKIKGY